MMQITSPAAGAMLLFVAGLVGGSLCILAAIWFSIRLKHVRRAVRPIYIQLGILPEVVKGLQAVTSLQNPPER